MAYSASWRTTMAKLHKPEEIIAKLRQVEVMTGQVTSDGGCDALDGRDRGDPLRWRCAYGG
jgi:hypothetical protein